MDGVVRRRGGERIPGEISLAATLTNIRPAALEFARDAGPNAATRPAAPARRTSHRSQLRLNWWEFGWLNWYYLQCQATSYNWYLRLTWGPFTAPRDWGTDCDPFQFPDGVYSTTNQYVWGDGGGIALMNGEDVVRFPEETGSGDPDE
ncbi:MAG TPA: hypothetical protein VFJ58_26565 [Armatimonadota bacterium]|nr:hypothetical protein [Armatimonadota bacterium]